MNDFETKLALQKVARLNEQLEKQFGLTLDVRASTSHLKEVREHYLAKKEFLLSRGLTESLSQKEYAKALLISEAIAMILREIAPKRLKPRTSPRKER